MKVQVAMSYESLAKTLGLTHGLKIELVEVDRLKGQMQIVISGDLPPRTVNTNGFSPTDKEVAREPDEVRINYLLKEE